MSNECVFCKIINKQIPSKIEFESETCMAFHDIKPRAKIHILVIPKKHIPTVKDLTDDDSDNMGALIMAARSVAKKLDMDSYRLLISVGKQAGQEVFHIHMHVMSPD